MTAVDMANRCLPVVRPTPPMPISTWANQHIYLPSSVAAEPGRLNLARFPWLPEMLDTVQDPRVAENVWMLASQTGKTTLLICMMGYYSAWEPSPQCFKMPTQESAESFSKEKFQPVIESSPELLRVYGEAKSRNSDSTISFKRYRGGFVAMLGSNSPSELRRRSVRVALQDELDSDAVSSGIEGSPSDLLDKRTLTFSNRILVKSSTPTIKGTSLIESKYLETDQRRFFVPCVQCGEFQFLEWDQFHYDPNCLQNAYYECKFCHLHWNDVQRLQSIGHGRWKATAPFKGKAGFHLSGLYRVIGIPRDMPNYMAWFAHEHLEAKRNDQSMVVFTNTFLAQTFDSAIDRIEPAKIKDRTEAYTGIPNEVVCLVVGADCQGDRIEAELKGIGKGEESWTIEYAVFQGDPKQPKVWQDFDTWLLKPRQRNDGTPLKIYCAAIDTGYATDNVYAFCRPRWQRKIYAVKGIGGYGKPLVSRPLKSGVRKARLYLVGSDTGKGLLYSRLNLKTPGPGYMHFSSGLPPEYFDELTAEVPVKKWQGGRLVTVFENPEKKPNEVTDVNVYIFAAIHISRPNFDKLSDMLPVKEGVQAQPTTLKQPQETATQIQPEADQEQPKPIKKKLKTIRIGSNWATRW